MTSEVSARLGLSYLQTNQAQKHVTVNESFRLLDASVQSSVISRQIENEPENPGDGDSYLLTANASGPNWSGFAQNDLVVFVDNFWQNVPIFDGFRTFVQDENALLIFANNAWNEISGGGAGGVPDTRPKFGINTQASDADRLSVKTDNVLLSHDDQTPGTGDLRLKINKASANNTASLLFQDDFSGKAEIGLNGENHLSFKVSGDGQTFINALRIDSETGECSFPNTPISNVKSVVISSGSGTYTPTPGVKSLKVTIIGGGGGGAGAKTNTGSEFVGAGGGGAGGFCIHYISFSDLAASYSYSVGVGGAGGEAGTSDPVGSRNGSDATPTTFSGGNMTLSAGGGKGAIEDTATTGLTQFDGGLGGSASGADFMLAGQKGEGGLTRGGSSSMQIGIGIGASTVLGQGGGFKNGTGVKGEGYGSGGSGCGMVPGFVLNRKGGAGADGIIFIEEYF